MPIQRICKICGKKMLAYNTIQNKCRECTLKNAKPIPQRGKQAKLWETFRDQIARPYLDKKYGHVCNELSCTQTSALTVDHVLGRGSHPELRLEVTNMQYLCFTHHRQKTDGVKLQYKHRIYPRINRLAS